MEQDYDDREYIVVDGGSTDGSVEIIKEYADRLAWWVCEQDSGQAEAINKGLAHAHGEIVAWLNSDDFYLPGAIAAAVRALQAHPAAVLVYGNMQAVDGLGRMTNLLTYRQRTLEDLLCFNIIGQPAVFMRREAVLAVGGVDPALHALLDHQLWIKLALHGEILHVDATWAAARYHPGAKNWARAPEFGREAFQVLEWESQYSELVPVFRRVERRARALSPSIRRSIPGRWGTALGGSEGLGPGFQNSSTNCSCPPEFAWPPPCLDCLDSAGCGRPFCGDDTDAWRPDRNPCLSLALQLMSSMIDPTPSLFARNRLALVIAVMALLGLGLGYSALRPHRSAARFPSHAAAPK